MAKKKSKIALIRTIIIDGGIFAGLIWFTFWLIFKDQDLGQVIDVAMTAKLPFLLLAVLLMLGYFLVEAWNVTTLLKNLGEKVDFWNIFRLTLLGFFFCSVTPGASGGQPIEIYYMSREGISVANATLAIMIQTCGIQFAVTGLGLICAIIGNEYLSGPVAFLYAIGLLINLTALIVLLLCIFFTGGLRRFLRSFFGFLWRIGLKKADKWRENVDAGLDKYNEGAKYIREHKDEFKKAIWKTTLQMSLYFLVPFMIYLAFGLSEFSVISFFSMQAILFMATSGLPIPGAIGASESVFLSLYGVAFGTELLGSAMILSRGISFYLFVLVSMVFVFVTMVLIKKKHSKK